MKQLLLVLLTVCAFYYSDAQIPFPSTCFSFGGTDNDFANRINGNKVVGTFNGTCAFGNGITLNSNGGSDGYFAWFAALFPNQAYIVKQFGGTGNDECTVFCVDSNYNMYVAGNFSSTTIDIEGNVFNNNGGSDVFIVKYDGGGNLIWAKQVGGSAYDYVTGIAVDSLNNVFLTGYFAGTGQTFVSDAFTLTCTGVISMWVEKLDPNGATLWATKAGGLGATGNVRGVDIGLDAVGNSYVLSRFSNGVDFVSQQINSVGNMDAFVATYNSSGVFQSAATFYGTTGTAHVYPTRMITDANGFCTFVGYFDNTIYLGPNTYVSNGGFDAFVAKINAAGNVQWSNAVGGINDDKFTSIIDYGHYNTGYLISGSYSGTINLQGGSLQSTNGSTDCFILGEPWNGGQLTFYNFGTFAGNGFEEITDISGVYPFYSICGNFDADIAGSYPDTLVTSGLSDVFVMGLEIIVGIDENQNENSISLFPNPSNNIITVNFNEEKLHATGSRIQIINTNGEKIYDVESSFSKKSKQIDVSKFPSGVYAVMILNDDKTVVKKFVKL